jgi:hypothetical protein
VIRRVNEKGNIFRLDRYYFKTEDGAKRFAKDGDSIREIMIGE